MAACGWMPPLGVFRSATRAAVRRAAPVPLHAGVRITTRTLTTRTASAIRRIVFGSPNSGSPGGLFGRHRVGSTAEVVSQLGLVSVAVEAEDRHAVWPQAHPSTRQQTGAFKCSAPAAISSRSTPGQRDNGVPQCGL